MPRQEPCGAQTGNSVAFFLPERPKHLDVPPFELRLVNALALFPCGRPPRLSQFPLFLCCSFMGAERNLSRAKVKDIGEETNG